MWYLSFNFYEILNYKSFKLFSLTLSLTPIDQLLKHPHIQKRTEMVKSYGDEDADSNLNVNLLQTIKIPKNLLVLSDRLPQANYAKSESKFLLFIIS